MKLTKETPERQAEEVVLNDLAITLYRESRRVFRPLYPWVFVRVLPKEQMVAGGLLHSPQVQNKTVWEAIVLETWQPFLERRLGIDHKFQESHDGECVYCGAQEDTHHPMRRSELAPGDHVFFPHWCGQPVEGHRPDLYRCVKECDWEINKDGGILGKIEHARRPEDVLHELLGSSHVAVQKILDRFVLIDKQEAAVTLSGV